MKPFKLYLEEMRVPFFSASILPVLLGAMIAWARFRVFHPFTFILTLLGGVLLHAGTNVVNDYYDHVSGNDEANTQFVRPFTGGSRMIQKGLLSPREVLFEGLLCFGLGSLIGVYLAFRVGLVILLLGAIGVFSGFFYTAPPFRLVATGFGELLVGLNFGTLMTLGSFYVQTRFLAWEPVWASLPLALLIAAVLYINEFQDCEADKAVGKDHWVARVGRARAVKGYAWLLGLTYALILAGVLLGKVTPWALLGLLTAPIAWKGLRVAMRFYDDYLKLAPANAATIMAHLLTGVLLCLGYLVQRLA
jgi:1,4-dihydroxy-2-naphthoate octaprenyltransferase